MWTPVPPLPSSLHEAGCEWGVRRLGCLAGILAPLVEVSQDGVSAVHLISLSLCVLSFKMEIIVGLLRFKT